MYVHTKVLDEKKKRTLLDEIQRLNEPISSSNES